MRRQGMSVRWGQEYSYRGCVDCCEASRETRCPLVLDRLFVPVTPVLPSLIGSTCTAHSRLSNLPPPVATLEGSLWLRLSICPPPSQGWRFTEKTRIGYVPSSEFLSDVTDCSLVRRRTRTG